MASGSVSATDQPASPASGESSSEATRQHLRGSSLLFAGRLLSLAINFATQVLIVRYLSKTDFGVFAYGLSIVTMGQAIAVLGLNYSVSRFLPIYDEKGERDKVLGALVLSFATVLCLGLAFIVATYGLRNVLAGSVSDSDTAVAVLLIMVLLAPIQALDDLILGAFAVFSKPRAIFFRKHVMAPLLRLATIIAVISTSTDVRALAGGYVGAGALGVAIFGFLLVRTLREQGILERGRSMAMSFPARELFAFAIPLLAVDALHVVMNTSNIIMLGHFGDAQEVAAYRAVLPAAHLNLLVMTSFTLLFTPIAARLFAREDRQGIADLYWSTAVWIAIFTFPVFALTFSQAESLTTTLFGDRYASSATIMALLSLGYYFSAALGFNGLTLRVFGLVRYTVMIAVAATVANVAFNLALIPAYGALGAGIGTCATFIVHNLFKQAGLRRGTGISIFDRRHVRVYAVLLGAVLALFAFDRLLGPGFAVSVVAVLAVWLGILALTRRSLRIGATFPELLRVPLLRRFVS